MVTTRGTSTRHTLILLSQVQFIWVVNILPSSPLHPSLASMSVGCSRLTVAPLSRWWPLADRATWPRSLQLWGHSPQPVTQSPDLASYIIWEDCRSIYNSNHLFIPQVVLMPCLCILASLFATRENVSLLCCNNFIVLKKTTRYQQSGGWMEFMCLYLGPECVLLMHPKPGTEGGAHIFTWERSIIPILEVRVLKASYFINLHKLIPLVSW